MIGKIPMIMDDIEQNQTLALNNNVQQWLQQTEKIIYDLQSLNSFSENEFLKIGERLQNYSLQARGIAENTSSTAAYLSGAEIIGTIENLNEMLDRISRYLNFCQEELEENIGILQNILLLLAKVSKPIDGFERVVKTLRILGISTKVESARLSDSNISFTTLANDVQNLANLIRTKLNNILEGSAKLAIIIRQTLTNIIEYKEKQYKQATKILDNIKLCLKSLIEKHNLSSITTGQISEQSINIAKHIGEIVAALQFHDITRQKLEHVIEAMQDIAKNIRAIGNFDSLNDSITEEKIENIVFVRDVCNLQKNQLQIAKNEIKDAINNVMSGLQGVSITISNMSQATQHMVSSDSEDNISFGSEIETGIKNVSSSLLENSKLNIDLSLSMSSVPKMVSNMASFVQDIQQIGFKIELIALNGLVNAAHMGEYGAALSVLAEAIQHLSVDARDQIVQVSQLLKNIITAADNLKLGMVTEEDRNSVQSIVGEMINDMQGMLGAVHSVNDKVDHKLLAIDQEKNTFSSDLNKLISEISISDIFSRTMDTAISILENLINRAQNMLPASRRDIQSSQLKELAKRYTMVSERKIHHKITNQQSEDENITDSSVFVSSNNNEDLGDNVELF